MIEVTDPAVLAKLNGSPSTPTSTAPVGKEVTDPAVLAKLNGETNTPSKILAGSASLTRGAIEGAGQILAAPGNLLSATIQGGLHLLDKAGVVPDSMYQNFKTNTAESRKIIADTGEKALDYAFGPAKEDVEANPTISKVANTVGNVAASTVGAAGLVGKLGSTLNKSLGTAVNLGIQGILQGAGANPENPIAGGAVGGAIGSVFGGIAGKLSRSADIINDKIDDAERVGLSPFSEAGVKSIKGALDNSGKELTTEEVEKATKVALQSRLDSVAPKVDITQKPTDMIANLAMTNYPKVIKEQDALYAPLHEADVVADTPKLTSTLNTLNETTTKALPDPLPQNPTLDNLLTYRRQVAASINLADKAIKTASPTASFKTLEQLMDVKKAVTEDLNTTASSIGLGDQLAKADAFHVNQVKPFEVYNTESGKLVSPTDMTDTWTRTSKLLRPRLPNLTAMAQVATTLGPQGKQVFGYAYLQQAMERSMNVDGRIFPSKISGELNKLQNSGLAQHILTPELKEAFTGAVRVVNGIKIESMRNIAEGALKTTKGMDSKSAGMVGKLMNQLTHSTAGITLLRGLGSNTTPIAKIKNIISQLITTTVEKNASSNIPADSTEQQQQ